MIDRLYGFADHLWQIRTGKSILIYAGGAAVPPGSRRALAWLFYKM